MLFVVNLLPKTGVARGRIYPFSAVPWRLWVGTVGALVVFGLGADRLGFYEAAFLFLVLVAWMMAAGQSRIERPLLTSMAFAAGFDLLLYVAFKLVLRIPTPPGLLV